jgi:iron complex outermembrane receptor protein
VQSNFIGFGLSRSSAIAAAVIALTLADAGSGIRTASAAGETGPSADVATSSNSTKKKDDELEEVVVTGSLIPQARAEISTPVTVITAEQIETKGFATVADALQHMSFSTGSVQGGGTSASFTQGANTISLFGLDPSYTKFLIDGRPIADYPALYNGTENFVSISGIPTFLIDHIDVLPGAQSSIYGSDAIAGVINISLKKTLDGPVVDARYGWTTDGGGTDRRIGVADGWSVGNLNILAGVQYENTAPIWGYQRALTAQYVTNGTTPQTAARDWLVIGLFGQANGDLYYFEDPAKCANVASQYNNTTGYQTRAFRGNYCGSTTSGYYTVANGTEATQAYSHISYDINDDIQVFTDVLLDHDVVRYSTGAGFLSTEDDTAGPYYYYLDPRLGDYLNLQQIYSPEEAGGLNNTMDKNTTNSIRATAGVQGGFGASYWKYDVDFSYTENKLTEARHIQFENEINNFYSSIFGPSLGVDPNFGVNIYEPNYAKFYQPITPAEYASFSGYAYSYSRTEESTARALITDSRLFPLPGGDAGLAIVAEGGGQGWNYQPDEAFLDGQAYLNTATAGSGHRARYAATTELRMPVLKMLTFDFSGRYDDYKVEGSSVDAATYNLGTEFRPLENNKVLLRGRYGTAFKAPTLADEFQGPSGFFTTLTDYYACTVRGYTPPNYTNAAGSACPYAQDSFQGTTSGNTQLKPITAKVWDVGIVLAPMERSSFSVDFIKWKINNEVQELSGDQLLKEDSACLLGTLDPASPTCVAAIANVMRDANGLVTLINTPKLNLAEEALSVIAVSADYTYPTTHFGSFTVQGQYTNILRHSFIQFAGDAPIDLLENPFFSTEFKTRENLALTWNYQRIGITAYVERDGRTPNNAATLTTTGYDVPGGGRLSAWTLVNLSARYEILPGFIVEVNANNVFNKMPPLDTTYTGLDDQPYNSENYNPYGRSFFLEATYKYGK